MCDVLLRRNLKERDDIINRFREKKRRRVWKKKIRYHCRKNLADRRVRVKGRFVRRGSQEGDGAPSPSGDGSLEGDDLAEDDGSGSEGEDGGGVDADAATTGSSVEEAEPGSKRALAKAGDGEKKAKKPRRVLFDESAVDNSSNGPTSSGGSSAASESISAADGDNSEGYSRMRRHSIAY